MKTLMKTKRSVEYTMRKRWRMWWPRALLLCAVLTACNVKQTHMILIWLDEIEGATPTLAQELLQYDPIYLGWRIPSLQQGMWSHIRWGIKTTPNEPILSIWVELNLANEDIAAVDEQLAREFDAGFREIAREHIARSQDFVDLELRATHWLQSLMTDPSDKALFEATTDLFQTKTDQDRLITLNQDVRNKLGEMQDLELVSRQFYRGEPGTLADGQVEEDRIFLYFQASFSGGGQGGFGVTYEDDTGWKLSSLSSYE
jgi:hypothetical protein